jgi:hypothetical protein
MGEVGYGKVVVVGWDMAYLDKSASVCDGGLLAHLLHDFGFGVHFGGDLGGLVLVRVYEVGTVVL